MCTKDHTGSGQCYVEISNKKSPLSYPQTPGLLDDDYVKWRKTDSQEKKKTTRASKIIPLTGTVDMQVNLFRMAVVHILFLHIFNNWKNINVKYVMSYQCNLSFTPYYSYFIYF